MKRFLNTYALEIALVIFVLGVITVAVVVIVNVQGSTETISLANPANPIRLLLLR